jgi:hypothetical protein
MKSTDGAAEPTVRLNPFRSKCRLWFDFRDGKASRTKVSWTPNCFSECAGRYRVAVEIKIAECRAVAHERAVPPAILVSSEQYVLFMMGHTKIIGLEY